MTEVEMREVLRLYRSRGYSGSFQATDAGALLCLTCHQSSDASTVHMEALHRIEDTTDPDAMAAVLALVCPQCETRGTMVSKYGPDITPEEANVLGGLQDHRRESTLASGW